MASLAIHLTALCSALTPINSLGFNPPIAHSHRHQQHQTIRRPSHHHCRLDRRHGKRCFALSMKSIDEDNIVMPTKDSNANELSGEGDRAMKDDDDDDYSTDPKPNPTSRDKHYFMTQDDPPQLDDRDKLSVIEKGTEAETILDSEIVVEDLYEELTTTLNAEPIPISQKKVARNRKNKRMQMFAYLSQPIVEVRIIGLVIVSCFLEAINTVDDLPGVVHQGIDAIDRFCVYIFAVEFFLRWWSAGRFQLKYLKKPLVAIDSIAVIIPLFLSGLLPIWDFSMMAGFLPYVSLPGWLLSNSANSALLNLRLLRILKFQRVLTDENTYMNFEMALGMKKSDVRPYQLQLAKVIISVFTLVSVSTGLIYTAEHEVNPQIPDYFTALYFGLTTLTTVGFGDITPVTWQGRLIVGGDILAGVAIIPVQAASLAEAYLDFQKERQPVKRQPDADTNAITTGKKCGTCGAGAHRHDASFCWSCGVRLD